MKLPELTTNRLSLRALIPLDAPTICDLRSNKEVNAFLDRPPAFSMEESIAFIDKINTSISDSKSYYWAISLQQDPELIGTICIWNISEDKKSAEIGFELFPAWQRKGVMNEALGAVISFCFVETTIKELWAVTHIKNKSSIKLLLKHGFEFQPGMKGDEPDLLFYKLERTGKYE